MSYNIPSLIGKLTQEELGRRANIVNEQFLLGHLNTNNLLSGGASTITFTANAATTTLTFAPNVLSTTSQLILMPKTSNAAAAMNTWWESARSVSSYTITLSHANNAQTDRTFGYVLIG